METRRVESRDCHLDVRRRAVHKIGTLGSSINPFDSSMVFAGPFPSSRLSHSRRFYGGWEAVRDCRDLAFARTDIIPNATARFGWTEFGISIDG